MEWPTCGTGTGISTITATWYGRLSLVEDTSARRELHELIRKHYHYTGSPLAGAMLDNWNRYVEEFIAVVPIEYKRVLQQQQMEALSRRISQVERDY